MTATILVVDDEPDLETLIQQKFCHQIRDGEVSFLFARDGAEALNLLHSRDTVDVVLTDINMPRMDGLMGVPEPDREWLRRPCSGIIGSRVVAAFHQGTVG